MSHLVALVLLLAVIASPLTAAVAAPPARGDGASAAASVGTGVININTAGVKELMTLSGVGRSLAEKIVKHRDAHGLFKKPEDLRKVEGVGGGLWEKNRERIVVK
jgi:competence protein ComEA